MRIGPFPRRRAARLQRGAFALIAILALAALITAFLIASALNRSGADISNERLDRNLSALRQAKVALIAYAANEQWQFYRNPPPSGYFQPGSLPCPDLDDDGDADCVGFGITSTSSIIGRLPWKTVGIDDLRDASGERLWYALSHDFRKLRCSGLTVPPNCTVINSDTQGQLTVTGAAPATQVVAIIFAPGAALDLSAVGGPSQDRISGHNSAANYLEGFSTGDNIHYSYATTASPTGVANDQALIITQAELMAAVEPIVATNIQRDVKPVLQTYFTKWGAYPFAMTFAAPPALVTPYQGTSGQNQGLLPLTDDPNWFKWWKATVTQIPPGYLGTEIVTSWNCSINSSPLQAVCHISYTDPGPSPHDQARPDIKLQIFLQNANAAFADIPSPTTAAENLAIVDNNGDPVTNQGSPYGQFSLYGSVVPTSSFVTQTAVVAETGVLVYTGRLQNADSMNGGVTITIPLPTPKYLFDPAVNPNNASWFISNQWYRDAYYAVSPGYVSGGVPVGNPATCSPLPATPSCLTVKNLPAVTNDKRAIIVLAGRQLNGTTRPLSGNPVDYFENANLTAANGTTPFVYEHRAGAPTSINDRVVVVSP